ncbi:MAG: lysophospholipid acyltransferase family protein [Pirellulales bacterium]|nr:lysophospholipid acyltransferase family protein [Pirellulales bacterium]
MVVRVFICVIQAIRIETGHAIARGLAWLAGDVFHIRGKVLGENLRHAFPELSADQHARITREMWEHLFLLVVEVAHTPRKIHETNWRDFIGLSGAPMVVRELLSDRPTILVTAHVGNFEVGGYILGIFGFPTYTVARTLDNPHIDRFVNDFRGKTGQFIIPKNGGFDQIVSVLENKGVMTFLADQHAGRKGCWVEFFGRPASAHKAISLLSLDYDAPIVASYARRMDKPLQFQVCSTAIRAPRDSEGLPATVKELTQWYTKQLEDFVREVPNQYWWIHNRWKDPRPRRKKKAANEKKAA